MAKLTPKEKMEIETQNLIKCVTDIDETEDNFDICERFCLSNLFYHKFLDPDESKIDKVLTGVHQKFIIHAQPEKAENFQSLVEKYKALGIELFDLLSHCTLSCYLTKPYFWPEEIK